MANDQEQEDEQQKRLHRFRGSWIPHIRDPSPASSNFASSSSLFPVQTHQQSKAVERIAELDLELEEEEGNKDDHHHHHYDGGEEDLTQSDVELARKRVSGYLQRYRDMDLDAICELLIRRKCRQGCIVGLCSAGPAIMLPGWGTLASVLLGSVADVTLTTKLEVDLAFEISVLYEYALDDASTRKSYLLKVAGLEGLDDASMEADQRATQQAGERLALRTTEEVGKRSLMRFVPIVGATVGAGTNVVGIYVIGKRAQLICKHRGDELGTWRQSVDKFVVPKEISQAVANQVKNVPSEISLKIAEATTRLGQRAKNFVSGMYS